MPRTRVVVVPNWVDIDRFSQREPHSHVDRAHLDVLFVGRLTEEKGFVDLAHTVVQDDRLRLTTIGDRPDRSAGADQERVNHALAALAATGRHVSITSVPPAEMPEHFRAADVFVLPSWNEGLPISLLEAMSCGVASVVTPVGGMGELARAHQADPFALVVEPREPVALGEALGRLAGSRDLCVQLGARGRTIVEDEHSARAAFSILLPLYRDLRKTGKN